MINHKTRPVNLRRLGLIMAWIAVIAGVSFLAVNGLYYWHSHALDSAYTQARNSLLAGMPVNARTEAERLAFYANGISGLQDLPNQLIELNGQPWTVAVLIKIDANPEAILLLLDQARRGQTAVTAYHQAVADLEKSIAAFNQQGSEPAVGASPLAVSLKWYADRLAEFNRIDAAYGALSGIRDLELVGTLFSKADLGLDVLTAGVEAWRQPVLALQAILNSFNTQESKLEALYRQDPALSGLSTAEKTCDELLSEQAGLAQKTKALLAGLPLPLLIPIQNWQAGLDSRDPFIRDLKAWWQNAVQVELRVSSARTDRATARRYIADSLKETNVETAYLWTRTAQEYRVSMNTAIDFANIAIARTNEQIRSLTLSRQDYRPALGLESAVRQIADLQKIQPDEFWLAG